MRLLDQWLAALSPTQKVLDLGCGAGSLRVQLARLKVTGVDSNPATLAQGPALQCVCAASHCLPFTDHSFDLVICNHSFEHFDDASSTMREIRRVLTPAGTLFVTVPEGRSLTDKLYRLLFCGGGHVQRYTFESIVSEVQRGTQLHLAAWKELYSSFIFVNKRNFLPAPLGPLPGPFPRRMRWAAGLPSWCFDGMRIILNLGTRLADRCLSTRFSRYGWALAFSPDERTPEEEPGCFNVCMRCGAGFEEEPGEPIAGILYRCPYCSSMNCNFAPRLG